MPRCAIYTRKSTEEGLEQDFNSLDAQREACEAFIKSQRHEGWRTVRARFDDGGFSGGTIDRPALRRLLDAVQRAEIDTVVVYKVDRLSRSLTDFAGMVELFETRNVSFVSVTQQFNTTTSMGRLTLNVLLSFAQFEREVTAERIRDKIAASKKKGLWMGGPPPLGYDVQDRKLVANAAEAKTARLLFQLYLDLGTVRRLKEEADRQNIVTKLRERRDGNIGGGKPFSLGNLYQLLSNPLYIGRVAHRGETYPGQHEAIIDDGTWAAVQAQRARNAADRKSAKNAKSPALLIGLIYDETGDRLCPTHANKKGRRYRYYISTRLINDAHKNDDGWRLPAKEIERLVLKQVSDVLRDQRRLQELLHPTDQTPVSLTRLLAQAQALARDLDDGDIAERRAILQTILKRVDLSASAMTITLDPAKLAARLGIDHKLLPSDQIDQPTLAIPVKLRRRGVEAKLILTGPDKPHDERDLHLCRLVAQARFWLDQLASGEATSLRDISRRHQVHSSEVSRILPLAFLAPDIVEAIIVGRQPVELTARTLKRIGTLPPDWAAQRTYLRFTD